MSGDRNSGCRSSAVHGGSSGGRSSSAGKGGSGGKHPKGGGVKKAGWEDAGIEFYREAYPGALENVYDNSLRTLLPSKRYSIGTLGRATVRRRATMRTMRNARRRRQSSAATTLVHTTRRGSDTYLEVMPDLTQGVDEEETWEELQQIRLHAVSMQEKRILKRQLLSAPTLRTRGFAAVQLSRRKFTTRLKARLKEIISKTGIWHGSLRYVEGNFGTGLVAFFTFIKWLLFLNLFSSILIIAFILVPQILYTHPNAYCGGNYSLNENLIMNERMAPLTSSLSPIVFTAHTTPNNILLQPPDPDIPRSPPTRRPPPTASHEILLLPPPDSYLTSTTNESPTTRAPRRQKPPRKDKKVPRRENQPPKNEKRPPRKETLPPRKENRPSSPEKVIPTLEGNVTPLLDPFIKVFDPPNNVFVPLNRDFGPPSSETHDSPTVVYEAPPTDDPHFDETPDFIDFPDMYDVMYQHDDPASVGGKLDKVTAIDLPERNYSDLPVFAALFDNSSSYDCCFQEYQVHVDKKVANNNLPFLIQMLVDAIQGTGKIEISYMFYGFYPRTNFTIPEIYDIPYSLSLAYLVVMVCIFIISLILMVRKAAKGLRDSLRSSEGQFYQFSNLVFGGWDHCIENNKAATIKKKAIYNELKNFIETEKYKDEKEQRTRKERCRLYFKRLLINILVVIILSGAFFAIYKATSFSFKNLENIKGTQYWMTPKNSRLISFDILGVGEKSSDVKSERGIPWWETLLFEFLPSGTIVTLNIVVPQIFKFLVHMERYTPNFILTLTLIRTIFLRLASLVVLLFTVYTKIKSCEITEEQCVSDDEGCNDQIRCWETYVGQQMYKLTLLDLVIMALNTFVINLPRKVLGHKILRGSRIGQAIGNIEFEIPKHVLDIVYGQTLCWLGMFYAPLLPAITCIKLILVYYIKYFDCAVNTTQSSQLYRTSRSNSLFISILLFSFIVTIIPVGFSIAELKPSVSCGPFFSLPTIWNEIIEMIQNSPQWLQSFLFFLGTAGFAVPTIILLILASYYYYAVAAANKHMVSLLKHQLVLEGHDKQFLLTRLDKMIKRTQELEDIHNRSEMSSELNGGEYSTSVNNDLTLDIRGGAS